MWTVPLFYIEPSTISTFTVEGSPLDIEPSMKRGINMDGSPCAPEPSTMSVFGVEGLLLDIEPSMKLGIIVDGSPCCP